MRKTEPQYRSSWKVRPAGWLRVFKAGSDEYPYHAGEFIDPRGIVTFYREPDYTSLTALLDGREHRWTYKDSLSDRTIMRRARDLLSFVAGE